jgi:predicted nuclease of restriction endonuclease-like (RecB) superfamily
LFDTIATLIKESRHRVSVTVNSELALLYWHIGKTIKKEVLKEKRAEYGKQIIEELSAKLTEFFGKGWGEKHLNHCLRSAVTFSEDEILYAVRRQLSWTHLRTIMYIENEIQREFYIELCIQERWSSRLLQERIGSMLYERTAISKKPAETIKQDLKLDKFKASYKGQMELYLRWLEKYESVEGENSPIGLILCTDTNKEHIELLRLKESNIKVATYYTALPPMELLQEKFHQAVKIARERIDNIVK